MKIAQKLEARTLRFNGLSINDIVTKVKVSKSSASLWTRDIILNKQQLSNLSLKNKARETIERRRFTRLTNAKAGRDRVSAKAEQSIQHLSPYQLKLIGIALYWGEGGKTQRALVRFSNSDSNMIRIMMRFFRETCSVPEKKFKGHIHMYNHEKVQIVEKYWSMITGIPISQFFKTYTKPSKASSQLKKTLPNGTFDIYICDTNLFLTIKGWMDKIIKLT